MTTSESLRPRWTVAWLLLHAWGLVCWALPWDTWRWYYLAVLVLELAGFGLQLLGRCGGRMWSPQVWRWAQPDGRVLGWRGFAVHAWSLYFGVAFMAVRPWFGGSIDVGIAGIVLLWLEGGHFLHPRRAEVQPHG